MQPTFTVSSRIAAPLSPTLDPLEPAAEPSSPTATATATATEPTPTPEQLLRASPAEPLAPPGFASLIRRAFTRCRTFVIGRARASKERQYERTVHRLARPSSRSPSRHEAKLSGRRSWVTCDGSAGGARDGRARR